MYSASASGLGEDTSIMSSVTNFLNTAIQTGGSVYAKVQQLTMQQQQAKQQAEQQAMLANAQQWQFAQRLQSSSGMGSWMLPIALGGGALALFFFLKK